MFSKAFYHNESLNYMGRLLIYKFLLYLEITDISLIRVTFRKLCTGSAIYNLLTDLLTGR